MQESTYFSWVSVVNFKDFARTITGKAARRCRFQVTDTVGKVQGLISALRLIGSQLGINRQPDTNREDCLIRKGRSTCGSRSA